MRRGKSRYEDGTLALANHHQFGERVDMVVRDGTAQMLVEKDCSADKATELNVQGGSLPEPTVTQGEQLDALLDEVDDTLADIDRELRVRPKEGVHVEDKGPRTFSGCAAGKRSGARWYEHDVVYAEATRDDELGPTGSSTRRPAGRSSSASRAPTAGTNRPSIWSFGPATVESR